MARGIDTADATAEASRAALLDPTSDPEAARRLEEISDRLQRGGTSQAADPIEAELPGNRPGRPGYTPSTTGAPFPGRSTDGPTRPAVKRRSSCPGRRSWNGTASFCTLLPWTHHAGCCDASNASPVVPVAVRGRKSGSPLWFGVGGATLFLDIERRPGRGRSVGVIRQVASAAEFGMPPMSWEGIDHALNRVLGESERISLDLADLDRHGVYRLLRETDLMGRTRLRWEAAQVHVRRLWRTHTTFDAVIGRAARLRTSGGDLQSELTHLLTGESVDLPLAQTPPRERGLPCPDTESITLAEATARMSADHEAVTEVVSAVETAWEDLRPRLGELEAIWQEVGTLADMVEVAEDEYEGLREDLARAGETVRRDPLALVIDGGVDTSALDRLRAVLDRTRGELRDALRMRDSYTESVGRLGSAIEDVDQVVRRARDLRARVMEKISAPKAIDLPDPVPDLREAVARMGVLRSRKDWTGLGTRLGELQRSVHEAWDEARERERDLTGLLRRRAELRGRLDVFHARAVRLGLAEHERLVETHGRAHRELWNTPCDLGAATVALSAYEETLRELSGTEPLPDRTRAAEGASEAENDGGVSR